MINPNTLFDASVVFEENRRLSTRYKILVNQGGTYSTKTVSILKCCFLHAIEDPGCVVTVVGQDIPNLKKGSLRDAKNIVSNSEILSSLLLKPFNNSDRIYEFTNNSIIEFTSYDDWQDAKNGKRQYLFINEANGISYKVFEQLEMRTEKNVYIDYNPDSKFWVHEKVIGRSDTTLIRSWHQHNTFLTKEQHEKIEAIDDPELFKVYARGETGKIEGVIFRYEVIPDLPRDKDGNITSKFIASGLDFGFTNDVSALIDVYIQDGELILDEQLYERGLVNAPIQGAAIQPPNISDRFKELSIPTSREIVADSAEQKSIATLQAAGWYITPAQKGPDSIKTSIDILKRYKIKVTNRSHNLKKELNSYKWKQNKDGNLQNEPVDFMNHLIDGLRYVALNKLNNQTEEDYINDWFR